MEGVGAAVPVAVGDGGAVAVEVGEGGGVAVESGAAVGVAVGVAGGRVSLLEHAVRLSKSTATTATPRRERNVVSPPPTRDHAIAAKAKSPARIDLPRAGRAPPQRDDPEHPEQSGECGQAALPDGRSAGDRARDAHLLELDGAGSAAVIGGLRYLVGTLEAARCGAAAQVGQAQLPNDISRLEENLGRATQSMPGVVSHRIKHIINTPTISSPDLRTLPG